MDASKCRRPGGLDGEQALTGALELLRLFRRGVEKHGLDAEKRTLRASRLLLPALQRQGREHVRAGLGLPPGVDDGTAILSNDARIPTHASTHTMKRQAVQRGGVSVRRNSRGRREGVRAWEEEGYHFQASGLMGSPTVPRSLRLALDVRVTYWSPAAMRDLIAVGAV